MLSIFFLISLISNSAIARSEFLNNAEIEKIEKEMSREVEEEFADKEHQDELAILRAQFAATHPDNVTYIYVPNEFSINANQSELFEGDIKLTAEQWKVALDFDPENPMKRRQGLTSVTNMWSPMGTPVIPYAFYGLSYQEQQIVRDAMTFWEQRTCIRFRPATSADVNAIIIKNNERGCWSEVGRIYGRRQNINLQAPGCSSVTIAAHEISHSFGTLHVQSRVDRDTYVAIDTTNIERGTEHNFRMEPNGFSTYGIPYEFGSMQHYFPFAFAVDPRRPTIYARQQYQSYQGSMDGPRATFWDTVLINKMYKCTSKCPRQMNCQNGGVTDGANCNKCFCPRGWTGTYCEQRPSTAQITNVSANPQNIRLQMTTPFNGFEEKLVVLQAPAGKRIEAKVTNINYRSNMCRSFGLEVIPTKDTRYSGFRFCDMPNPSTPIYSDSNTMLLWLYRDDRYNLVADVTVRYF